MHREGSSRASVMFTVIPKELEKRAHRQIGVLATTEARASQQFFGGTETLPWTKSRHGRSGIRAEEQSKGAGAGPCAGADAGNRERQTNRRGNTRWVCLRAMARIARGFQQDF